MDEHTLIKLAIDIARQDRYLQLLSKPKKRQELLEKLNHNPPLNSKNTKWLSSLEEAVQNAKVSPTSEVCLISSAPELDGKTMSFDQAISEVDHYGWGTIIGISPSLAIYYGESGESAAVISKNV